MCRFGQQIVLPFLLGWILCILILFEMLSQTIEPTAPVVDVDVMVCRIYLISLSVNAITFKG